MLKKIRWSPNHVARGVFWVRSVRSLKIRAASSASNTIPTNWKAESTENCRPRRIIKLLFFYFKALKSVKRSCPAFLAFGVKTPPYSWRKPSNVVWPPLLQNMKKMRAFGPYFADAHKASLSPGVTATFLWHKLHSIRMVPLTLQN